MTLSSTFLERIAREHLPEKLYGYMLQIKRNKSYTLSNETDGKQKMVLKSTLPISDLRTLDNRVLYIFSNPDGDEKIPTGDEQINVILDFFVSEKLSIPNALDGMLTIHFSYIEQSSNNRLLVTYEFLKKEMVRSHATVVISNIPYSTREEASDTDVCIKIIKIMDRMINKEEVSESFRKRLTNMLCYGMKNPLFAKRVELLSANDVKTELLPHMATKF